MGSNLKKEIDMSGGGTTAKPLKAVKSILVSQPAPENGKSAFYTIRDEFKIKVDFRSFIHVEGVEAREFRKSRIYLDQFSSVILTSRNAIEHYFRMHDELRLRVSQETKYFCKSEAIALYLQKYTQYRKRKIFFGDGQYPKLIQLINKHKEKENFYCRAQMWQMTNLVIFWLKTMLSSPKRFFIKQ